MKNTIVEIYQIKKGEDTRKYRFRSLKSLAQSNLTVEKNNYDHVYTTLLKNDETLEAIYKHFNTIHPRDFKGHSLSISDVIVLRKSNQTTAHYVDTIGFKDVPSFLTPEETKVKTTKTSLNELLKAMRITKA